MSDSTPWSVASLIAETKAQLRDCFAQLNDAPGRLVAKGPDEVHGADGEDVHLSGQVADRVSQSGQILVLNRVESLAEDALHVAFDALRWLVHRSRVSSVERPSANGLGLSWDPRRTAMKERPGKWLLWSTSAPGRYLRAAGFQVTVRGNGDGTYRIYARWPEEPS